jgi:hypothetical protein
MRAGKPGALSLTLVVAALIPVGPLKAAGIHSPASGISAKVRHLIGTVNFLAGPVIIPQALPQADSQGTTINPARLDRPDRIEHTLRSALRKPVTQTRLTVVGGSARLGDYSVGSAETVHGHVVVLEGDADLHGRVEGNLVTLDGDIILNPGAIVVGDVLAIGGHVRQAGGKVTGSTQEIEAEPVPVPPASVPLTIVGRAAGLLGVFATLVMLGFGLVTFGRPNLEIVSDTVAVSFGRSFLIGLLGQILVLPTFGMIVVGLVLTVAGALLVPFAVAVYALLAIVAVLGGLLAVAHAMGETITRRRMAHGVAVSPNSYRYLLTGLLSLAAVWAGWVLFGWVPVAGSVIFFAAALGTWSVGTVGFGAALLSRGGIRENYAGRFLPPEMMTDEYLWATPQFGVPAVKRPIKTPEA